MNKQDIKKNLNYNPYPSGGIYTGNKKSNVGSSDGLRNGTEPWDDRMPDVMSTKKVGNKKR